MNRAAAWFAVTFLASLGAFSLLFQLDAVEWNAIVPLTGIAAHASNLVLNLLGMKTHVSGTTIAGDQGFSVNIMLGCNGAYVTAIVVSAVLAFPSTWREKLIGLALGIPGVQVVNLVRIVSLFYIGVNRPDLFDKFHYYVWQTGVIILSMAIWIFWAEVFVGKKAPSKA